MTQSSHGRHTEAAEPHWSEWLVGLLSAGLIVFLIGWLGWKAASEVAEPPELSIKTTTMEPAGNAFRVTFDIENGANTTASSVTVRGELLRDGEVVETGDITFDYVPAESTASGAILFVNDPSAAEVRLRAVGWADP